MATSTPKGLSTLEAPIYLNLSGEYKVKTDSGAIQAGSVTGDLRLASLDAFLHALESALAQSKSPKPESGAVETVPETSLASAVKAMADHCRATSPQSTSLILAVTAKTDPATNAMTYTFNLSPGSK